MKKIWLLLFLVWISGSLLNAQHPVSIGTPGDDTLFINSGQNFLLIPDVADNEAGTDQAVTFIVSSSNSGILEINEVTYTAGNSFAIIHVTEKGVQGTVTITTEATDPDGSATVTFKVFVGPYNNPGINFEIHDVVFWQQVVPLDANPAFSMIAESGLAPYADIDLPSLGLSVYSDCQESPPCTGTDFFTAMFRGYLIPPATGDYYLYMMAGDQCMIGLNSLADSYMTVILHSSDGIGTSSGDKEWRSTLQHLEAGRVYVIYGVQWNIHTFIGGMLWEGPGIDKQYIPGQYLSYVYDVDKPALPENLRLETTGLSDLRFSWSAATDDQALAGYNVYVNGRISNQFTITDTIFSVTGLTPGTKNCVIVTSLDRAGNESPESEILSTTTYLADDAAPLPPATVEATVISDLAIRLEWSGAIDGETEIRGYELFVNGELYNTEDYIYQEGVTLFNLVPETSYQIEISSVDAAFNVSEKSTPYMVSTAAFDPMDNSLTDKKARLKISMENIGINLGLAINPDFLSGEFLEDPEQVKVIKELEVAGIRWGALTANPLSFEDYIGAGKTMTLGRFMNFCNSIGAYSIITCGVESSTDWMLDPETFTSFLEYIAGPSGSVYGAKRAAEGYSESLLENSPGLIFEFGNEVWGATAHNAQIGSDYTAYGEWCREMARLMKSSVYYEPDKIFLVYSGREPQPANSYGLHDKLMKGDTGEVDWLAVGGYLGGNLEYAPEIDPGASELDYYRNGIATVENNLEGMILMMKDMIKLTGGIKPTFMYEANMTKDTYFGRLGQAVVQTDYYAGAIETGGAMPTVFHLTGGQWKMVIPAQNYKKTPLFYTTAFYNKYCKGDILKTELETMATIQNSDGRDLESDPVGCYAYTKGDRYSLLFLSRDFVNDFVVQVDLPGEFQVTTPGTARKYIVSGDYFSDRDAVIDSSVITITDNLLVRVPKYSMVIITFSGEDQQFEPLPPGHYEYVSATAVTIAPFGSDDLNVTGSGKKIYVAEVEPEDVFSKEVNWEINTGNVSVLSMERSYGYDITGSGTCEGNGNITLRVAAWDNPAVFDEVVINISGQGANCGTGLDDRAGSTLRIYPNPAGDVLLIDNLVPGEKTRIVVTDLLGRRQITEAFTGQAYTLDISALNAGIYCLSIQSSIETVCRQFIKK